MTFPDRFDILLEIRFSIGAINLLFDKSGANALQSVGFAMKKKFGRLLNTKTTEYNSDEQAELGEKTSRHSELAKKAIEAICNDRSAVESPVIPIQEIQPSSGIDAGKEAGAESVLLAMCECCDMDGIGKNMLVKIASGQFVCPACLEAMRSFKS